MTHQHPDLIIYRGMLTTMECMLLPSFPENHPRIAESSSSIASTGCYRGYVARWEIRETRLFLLSVEGCYALVGSEPLFADWFSGRLVIHYEWRGPEHGVFADGSRWLNKHAHLLTLRDGVVVQTKRAKYRSLSNCDYEPRDDEADVRQIFGDVFASCFDRNRQNRDSNNPSQDRAHSE